MGEDAIQYFHKDVMSLSCLASLIVGREFYRGKHGVTGSSRSGTPDLVEKSVIPENATLFSIFLLGKEILLNIRENPCDVTACQTVYKDRVWVRK
ncbi:hypothetical protein AVEN_46623-1, partial [Araneus ventricosus]